MFSSLLLQDKKNKVIYIFWTFLFKKCNPQFCQLLWYVLGTDASNCFHLSAVSLYSSEYNKLFEKKFVHFFLFWWKILPLLNSDLVSTDWELTNNGGVLFQSFCFESFTHFSFDTLHLSNAFSMSLTKLNKCAPIVDWNRYIRAKKTLFNYFT